MKVELTPELQNEINKALETNSVRRWLKHKDSMKFEVGDILLKYFLRTDYQTKKQSWVAENILSDTKMPQRYVYIFEDENGIGYMKQLRVSDGKFGKELFCITDFDLTSTRFEVDPEYAEHTLLDADFDIKQIHKRSLEGRKLATKMNRKIGVKPQDLATFHTFFSTLSKGDTFWTSIDYTGRHIQEHTLTDITTVSVQSLNYSNDWHWKRWKEKYKNGVNHHEVHKLSFKNAYGKEERVVTEYNNYIFYKQKPVQEEKK